MNPISTELRNRLLTLGGAVVLAVLFLLPTVFPGLMDGRSWLSKPLLLGLDLSGGVHLVYQVETDEAVKGRLQTTGTSIRSDLRQEKIPILRVQALNDGALEFTFLSDSLAEKARQRIEADHRELLFKEKSEDSGKVKMTFTVSEKYKSEIASNSVHQAIETLRARVDQFGVSEPIIQRVGADRIMLQMPGVSDVSSVKRVVGNVAKLEFRLIPGATSTAPKIKLESKEGGKVDVEDEVLMSGDAVDDARVSVDPTQGVEVSLRLTSEGGKIFRKITSENVGRNLAIILDNKIYSSPRINETIGGGQASISGGFTVDEARELAVVLRAGALPAPLTPIEERTVGPSLGRDSIQAGVLAIIIGMSAITIFMVFYYKKSGLLAVGTLVLNLTLILAALSALGATLTLPGLAGLALTAGMAVDSNVIIFERIRDELRLGATRDAAISIGFDKAHSAIIDANLCAFLTGGLLYFLGTGPIRGFAVVLCLGIIMTLFCAIFTARIFYDLFPMKSREGLSI